MSEFQMSSHRSWQAQPDCTALSEVHDALRETGRGKHVGSFDYYHVTLISEVETADSFLAEVWKDLIGDPIDYNVLKLDRISRVSFLMYQDFSAPFPALDIAYSCNIREGTVRRADYQRGSNPPILHRKELLLPEEHALVPPAVRLTKQLEAHGAFANTSSIGTRNGWMARLASVGLSIVDGVLTPVS